MKDFIRYWRGSKLEKGFARRFGGGKGIEVGVTS